AIAGWATCTIRAFPANCRAARCWLSLSPHRVRQCLSRTDQESASTTRPMRWPLTTSSQREPNQKWGQRLCRIRGTQRTCKRHRIRLSWRVTLSRAKSERTSCCDTVRETPPIEISGVQKERGIAAALVNISEELTNGAAISYWVQIGSPVRT